MDILQTSKAVLIFETAYKRYSLFEERLGRIYKNSALYAKTRIFSNRIIVIFRYSLLGKITENKGEGNLKETLHGSGVINCLSRIGNGWRKRAAAYLQTSLTVKHAIKLRNELYILPVKTGSVIIVSAVLSNLLLYALFKNFIQREIGLLGWVINGLLLFAGLAGLSCGISLEELKESSLSLKWLKR